MPISKEGQACGQIRVLTIEFHFSIYFYKNISAKRETG